MSITSTACAKLGVRASLGCIPAVSAVVDFTSRSHCQRLVLPNSILDLGHQGFDYDQLTKTSSQKAACANFLSASSAFAQLRYINAELRKQIDNYNSCGLREVQ